MQFAKELADDLEFEIDWTIKEDGIMNEDGKLSQIMDNQVIIMKSLKFLLESTLGRNK